MSVFLFPDFALRLIPKCGSANIQRWARKYKLPEFDVPPTGLPIYQVWRNPSERIWSGVATDLQRQAHPKGGNGQPWYKDEPKRYQEAINRWAKNLTLNPALFPHALHYLRYGNADKHIGMDQISKLHLRANISEPVPFDHHEQKFWLSAKILKKELKPFPDAISYVEKHIEGDKYIPELTTL